ncbi:MAG: histidine kinase [Bacteroidota bacterium]
MHISSSQSQKKNRRIDKRAFKRLILLYSIAVAAIALIIIVSERYLQIQLNRQLYDSRVVNLAGKQRMFSQKITKELLLISHTKDAKERKAILITLKKSLNTWTKTHFALINGDSSLNLPKNNELKIKQRFDKLTVIQSDFAENILHVISVLERDINEPLIRFMPAIEQVRELEELFLTEMNEIVGLYEMQAKQKVERAMNIQTVLAVISISILFFEMLFIFRPIALYVREQLSTLLNSEELLKRTINTSKKLQNSLEASNKDLKNIHKAIEEATFFARATKDGEIYYISEYFLESLHFNKQEKFSYNLFKIINLEDWNKLLSTDKGVWRGEVKLKTFRDSYLWIDASVVPVCNELDELIDILIICSDITQKKWAEQKVYQLNREKYLRKAAEQRENSIRIIEALEKERKRISRDIHDGLGQLLTALKFNLQSINLQFPEKAQVKLSTVKEHIKEIIQETRLISFNLTPSNLEDYGIASALKTLASKVSRQTEVEVLFNNKTNFTERLDRSLEVNIYRISQEAINNAVKHAKAALISVGIYHNSDIFEVSVEDNGNGFETKEVWKKNNQYRLASGILNMKERASFFGGKLSISSKSGEGTSVRITLPLKNMINV